MAGLETLTGDDPSGGESPTLGDNRIRELTQKVKESVSKEHSLSGYHAILSGNSTVRPVAGNAGRFYILINPLVAKELQYDNGSTWETITNNQTVIGQITALTDHKDSDPIDHVDESIKRNHLDTGILVKRHFGIANDNSSVIELVDGSETILHTHPKTNVVTADGRPTFFSSVIPIAAGTEILGKTASERVLTLSAGDVPDGAVAVILEGMGTILIQNISIAAYTPRILIQGRLGDGSNSGWLTLIGGYVAGTGDYSTSEAGWRGQGTFPINTTVIGSMRKLSIRVKDFNNKTLNGDNDAWEIRLVGYI